MLTINFVNKLVNANFGGIMRIIYLILGFITLALGSIGIILPVLPTTPFLLLTGFLFMKGSTRFHTWFINSKIYKKYLEEFDKNKVMKLHTTIGIIILVGIIFIISIYTINSLAMSIVFNVILTLKCTYFILKVKMISNNEYKLLKESRND